MKCLYTSFSSMVMKTLFFDYSDYFYSTDYIKTQSKHLYGRSYKFIESYNWYAETSSFTNQLVICILKNNQCGHFYHLLGSFTIAYKWLHEMLAESGRGSFFLRDVQRLAATHDFTWSEREIADMIYCFDSDGDGKVSTSFCFLKDCV